jgi:very-short-patch-repair endonuclease
MKPRRAERVNVPGHQVTFAKAMRREMTEAERKLWKGLRWRLMTERTHFRRQVPLGPYIVDFCSHGAKLIIEVDGNQHGDDASTTYDALRTAFLESQGYRVLRFANHDVMTATESVLDTVAAAITPTPDPSPQGGGEARIEQGRTDG